MLSMYKAIEYEEVTETATAHIRLDRPDKLNAIDDRLASEYVEALKKAEINDDIRVIVVSGNGEKAFSAGHDIDYEGEDYIPGVAEFMDDTESESYVESNWNCNKPIIAAVQGYCLAMGTELALSCDMVIATDDSEFGFPGVRMGGTPPNITYPFVMDFHAAKELLLSGKIIGAERAKEMGMINRIIPKSELWNEVEAEVDEIRKMPGQACRIMKHALNGIADMQGARPTFKYAEMFDALAHNTELGQEFYHVSNEEGMDGVKQWLNEKNKGMK